MRPITWRNSWGWIWKWICASYFWHSQESKKTLTLSIPVGQSHPHPVEGGGRGRGAWKHDARLNLRIDHIHCNTFQKYIFVVAQIKMRLSVYFINLLAILWQDLCSKFSKRTGRGRKSEIETFGLARNHNWELFPPNWHWSWRVNVFNLRAGQLAATNGWIP